MSIESKLNYLFGTKDEIRQAIQEKGVSVSSDTTFRQYADKIRSIETGSTTPPDVTLNLQEKIATPTGKDFEVTPDESYDGLSKVRVLGDFNLKPENIAAGITIYGITGVLGVPPEYGTTIPAVYQPYFDKARELYTGDYKNVMILESDLATSVGFLLDGFAVQSYDEETTEFTASKWVYVAYNKQTQMWKVEEHVDAVSGGNTFIKNIRFSDTYIYYGNRVLYPFLSNATGEIEDSWEEIVSGNGASYPIGSWKTLNIGSIDGVNYGRVNMEKVYAGESGTTSTWLGKTVLYEPRVLDPGNETNAVIGGWAVSELRTWLNDVFFNSLPYELRNSIKAVNKYTSIYDANGDRDLNNLTQDKIWIPSYQELFNSIETSGVYYNPKTEDLKKKSLQDNQNKPWWIRSGVHSGLGNMSAYVSATGSARAGGKSESAYISFGFCL